MNTACDSGRFSSADLRKLNYCRLYLNVTTLSDVCNAAGNRFAVSILSGTRSIQQSSSKGPSAKQERPSDPTWAIWRQLLYLLGDKHLLLRGLGPWHTRPAQPYPAIGHSCTPENIASSTIWLIATMMSVPQSAMASSPSLPKTNSPTYRPILFPLLLSRLPMDGASSFHHRLSSLR